MVLTQDLHDLVAIFGAYLYDSTQFFIEQCVKCFFFSPCADLL